MTAAEELRPLLFGNVPVEAWPSDDDATAEPWASFVRARRHLAAGDADLAIREWAPIATFDLWEPRHRLQAWTFLRSAGIQPDEGIARSVLGVVAEVSVGDGHDALAAYADGSIRSRNADVVLYEAQRDPAPARAERNADAPPRAAEQVPVPNPILVEIY